MNKHFKINKVILIILLLLLILNNIQSQCFEYLNINSTETYSFMFFRNNFGTFNKTILFHSQSLHSTGTKYSRMNDKYYILNADSNRINEINFQDSTYIPFAFLNNDTIVIRVTTSNEWIYFSYSQNKYIFDIPDSIKYLLRKVPIEIDKDEYNCKFDKSLNKMFVVDKTDYNSNLEIYSYNKHFDTVERKVFNFDKFYNHSSIIDAYWISTSQILLILINRNKQEYVYCVYNITNDNITKINYFNKYSILDDCFDNQCLVRHSDKRSYQAAIYEIDLKTLNHKLKYKIFEKYEFYEHSYRIGFVSPLKLARMSNIEWDMNSFSVLLNQSRNYIDSRFEKVE
jgi:hypothetical protein